MAGKRGSKRNCGIIRSVQWLFSEGHQKVLVVIDDVKGNVDVFIKYCKDEGIIAERAHPGIDPLQRHIYLWKEEK
jgi:hypothetical protein